METGGGIPVWVIPAILSGGVGLALVGTLLTVGRWVGKLETKHEAIEKTVTNDRSSFTKLMDEVRNDIKAILSRLQPLSPVDRESPLRLNDFGRELADCVGAAEWARMVADSVRWWGGLPEYEVDERAREYVNADNFSDLYQARIARCAYEHGADREAMLTVLAVVLRDAVLDPDATLSA